VCGSENLDLVIDLGHQPLCDSLLSPQQLNEAEQTYPLRLVRCKECSLGQIDYAVRGDVVYHPDYPYRSGITKELAEYQDALSAEIIGDLRLPAGSLAVDIGSNDGTLLRGFKNRGMRALGVEPTNIARIANQNGIETYQSFFTEQLARQMVEEHGHASVVTATNVFAHMAPLGEVMRGLEVLLPEGGVFMTESHYLLEIIRGVQYDSVYHEHLRSYSLKSLVTLLEMYDFTVVDARQVSRYGGNIRVYAARGKNRTVKNAVSQLLAEEARFGLYSPEVYVAFREKARRSKDDLLRFALEAARRGERLVGNSCPGRCSTLLNYCKVDRDYLPYIAEQPTSLKLGLYLPGMHIPIVDNKILIEEQPEYVVLLAWHLWKPISQQLRARGLKSKLVVPLPELHVLVD
jgi:hypothetical protein